jgi:hypothetical protein
MSRLKSVLGGLAALVMLVTLAACTSSPKDGTPQKNESKVQQDSYKRLTAAEPAHEMTYPVTRKTINFWVDTWNKPGKLAYTYLQNSNGDLIGYYVTQGPPVSMCTALTPTYKFVNPGGNNDGGRNNVLVPAPSVDGVYYSGGECNTYYAKDATSGAFIEFTAGLGINVLLYDQPLSNHPNVVNLAPGAHK